MGEKVVVVDRKLGVTARKLVTTAGGAPCCCETEPGGCPIACESTICTDCLQGDRPRFFPFLPGTFDVSERAALRAATDEMFAGFACAECRATKVVVEPWTYSAQADYAATVSATFLDPIELCALVPTAERSQLWFIGPSGIVNFPRTSITWMHPNYGFSYSQSFDFYAPGDPPRVPVCRWFASSMGDNPSIDPSRILITLKSNRSSQGDEINFTRTVPADVVNVSAELYRLTEYVENGSSPEWVDYAGAVVLVFEYEITCAFGDFYLYPSPPEFATDGDKSPIVNVEDWGGWVSCKKVRITNFGGDVYGIAASTQNYKNCNANTVCGSVFRPVGVTTLTPFGLTSGGASPEYER